MVKNKVGLGSAIIILVVALSWAATSWQAQAAPVVGENVEGVDAPPLRPFYSSAAFYQAIDPHTASRQALDQTPNQMTTIPGWNRIVFQAYRGSNWEIYFSDWDNQTETNISIGPGTDIEPRLTRDCTRVTFASNRSGLYQIYTMNPDGSDVRQLTHTDGNVSSPAWSPDGTKIVYDITYGSQVDVYLMNADGSGQTRLTTEAGYEGQPSWSPDGSQILFISNRTGGYRVYVMNLDGSGVTQLSNQAYSAHPAWSPDGAQIVYDADGDGDGWKEVWSMASDGSNQHQVYKSSSPETDVYVSGWRSGGIDVTATEVSWIYYQGYWYWTHAYAVALSALNFEPDQSSRFHSPNSGITSGDTDWNPDWQSTDHNPPAITVTPLSAISPWAIKVQWSGSDNGESGIDYYSVYVRDGAGGEWTTYEGWTIDTTFTYLGKGGHTYYFGIRAIDKAGNIAPWPSDGQAYTTVENLAPSSWIFALPAMSRDLATLTWIGSDPGGSGVKTYDVQYRQASSIEWVDLVNGTSQTTITTTGTTGTTYYYRVRSTDWAQNVEAWPVGDGDTTTTFYAWQVSGQILDNTETPIIGASAQTSYPIVAAPSDAEGSYISYAGVDSGEQGYTVHFDHSDYGLLPDYSLPSDQDGVLNVVLPPSDNVVKNWGFEADSPAEDWIAAGNPLPTFTTTVFHSGETAGFLGQVSRFSTPMALTSDPSIWNDGETVKVDADGRAHLLWIEKKLYYATVELDGSMSAPVVLATGVFLARPQMAIAPDGTLHVIYASQSEYDLYYLHKATDGTWSSPDKVPTENLGNTWSVKMMLDQTGYLHIVFEDKDIYYIARTPAGIWLEELNLSNSTAESESPQMALHPDGGLSVVWYDESTGAGDIYYRYRSPDGNWAATQIVDASETRSSYPDIVIDQANVPHLVWRQETISGDQVLYSTLDSQQNWIQPQIVSSESSLENSFIAIHPNGLLRIFWISVVAQNYVLRCAQQSDGVWFTFSLTDAFTSIYPSEPAGDENNNLYLAWTGSKTEVDNRVYYLKFSRDGGWSAPQLIYVKDYYPNQYYLEPEIVIGGDNKIHVMWSSNHPESNESYYASLVPSPVTRDAILAQRITIPATMHHPGLSFFSQAGNLSDQAAYFRVEADDGITTTIIASDFEDSGDWVHHWYDLSAWASQTITLTFHLHQEAGYPNALIYLDEISLGSAHSDVWVTLEADKENALPGEQVIFTLTTGNRGGIPAQDLVITDTLPAGLTFISASAPPTVTGNLLVWQLDDVSAKSAPVTILITTTVNENAVLFNTTVNRVDVNQAKTEIETGNNTSTREIYIGQLIFLPLLHNNLFLSFW